MVTRKEVYAAIDSERDYQKQKGIATHGVVLEKGLEEYVLYMESYLNQAREQLSRIWGPESYRQALHTIRKITALGVAAMEDNGALKRE